MKYIDESGDYLSDDFGRCDREVSCGYHQPPDFNPASALYSAPVSPEPAKPSTLPFSLVKRSQGKYGNNTLIQWMATLPGWDVERAVRVAERYHVGTSNDGWAIFWQVDHRGKVRSGKMISYDSDGHRIKDEDAYCYDWVHSVLKRKKKIDDFELVQCLFGLHLLDDKPIAIVESEKTALIASQYLPQFTWMASGMLQGISEYKLRPLRGKKINLFPDKGAFSLWSEKAAEIDMDIKVSSLLERKAPDEDEGFDIADYLIQYNLKEFLGYPADWDNVEAPQKGTAEYRQAIRYAINDACQADEILDVLINEWNAEIENPEALF